MERIDLRKLKHKLQKQKILNNKITNLKKNDYVIYQPKNESAKIIDIHNYENEPYYTILLSTGERQTTLKNLLPI